jgi:hypothetical protein
LKSKQSLKVQLSLILVLSGCANLQHSETRKTSFGGSHEGAPSRRVSEAELQDDLLRFESQFNAKVQDADRDLESSSDAGIRYRAAVNRLIYSTNSLGIATGPNPEANLLDMVTFIELSRDVLEKHWIPEVFGSGGAPLHQAFRQSAEQVWGIADKVLGPQQKQILRNYIRNWREKHPDQVNVETVRLSAFSYDKDLAANEQKDIGGLFASVQQATEAADSARLFAERALYYAERAPTLLRLQAKLGAHEIMNEIGSSLTQLPVPLSQKREITDLLTELQKTLRITQATLVDANDTVNSVSHLFEQQAGSPDVGRSTKAILAQLTTLLREWNQMVTSPRYQSGTSKMAGIAGNLEQSSNRLLIRIAELGAGLIAFFWLMALFSMLTFRFISNSSGRRQRESNERRNDKAA